VVTGRKIVSKVKIETIILCFNIRKRCFLIGKGRNDIAKMKLETINRVFIMIFLQINDAKVKIETLKLRSLTRKLHFLIIFL